MKLYPFTIFIPRKENFNFRHRNLIIKIKNDILLLLGKPNLARYTIRKFYADVKSKH